AEPDGPLVPPPRLLLEVAEMEVREDDNISPADGLEQAPLVVGRVNATPAREIVPHGQPVLRARRPQGDDAAVAEEWDGLLLGHLHKEVVARRPLQPPVMVAEDDADDLAFEIPLDGPLGQLRLHLS